ncbi:MAG: hypothetical protein WDM90_13595 [Ferruginibacter sp.]
MIKRTLYFGSPAYLKTKDKYMLLKAVTAAPIDAAITKQQRMPLLARVLLSSVIVLN